MTENILSVREIQKGDIKLIADYWLDSEPDFLIGMGVDLSKVPSREDLIEMLSAQLNQQYNDKKSYAIIWMVNDIPVGHCNINKIIFGEEAYMHLHLWKNDARQKGLGLQFIKLTLPYFFENMKLKKLFCEPYSLNDAPNKTLFKAGFEFVKSYITTPGFLNFEQPVNLWVMSYEKYKEYI